MTDWPITIAEVARRFGASERRLKSIARKNGIGKKAGRAIILDQAAFKALYEALPCPSPSSGAAPAAPATSAARSAPTPRSVSTKLRERLTRSSPSSTGRSARRSYMKHPSTAPVLLFPSSRRR